MPLLQNEKRENAPSAAFHPELALPRIGNIAFTGIRHDEDLPEMCLTTVLCRTGRGEITMRGFRLTFRDWCTGLVGNSFPLETCEHPSACSLYDKLEATYRHGNLIEKLKLLMQKWADFPLCSPTTNTRKARYMTDEQQNPNAKIWRIENIYFISLYFITTGSLYLWGYWSKFNINILEYIDITDIIKLTAFNIAICSGIILLAISGGEFFARKARFSADDVEASRDRLALEIQEARNKKNKNIIVFALILVLILSISISIYANSYLLPLCTIPGVIIQHHAFRRNILSNQIRHRNIRRAVIFFISCLPFISFGWGTNKANNVINGKSFSHVVSDFSINKASDNADSQLRYLGNAGDHLFFYNPKRSSTVIVKFGEENILEISKHRTKKFSWEHWTWLPIEKLSRIGD